MTRSDLPTRRRFLRHLGQGAAAGGGMAALLNTSDAAAGEGRVGLRELGKTGLKVSEIGFGGHSWAYKRVPDGNGGYRLITVDEATEMIGAGMDMGVNFFDSCSAMEESSVPGEALKRLKRRDKAVVSVRVSHKMQGVENDKREIYDWLEKRLKLWQTDYIDLLMLSNEASVTEKSGYWDMSHSIEAIEKLKQQGKIRFAGFGSHFTPRWFREAFDKFADHFDVCSMPYNVRHRQAEEVIPAAKKAGLGVITIKPFARGSLLKNRDLDGDEANLPRDMIAFVLQNKQVDVCLCGLHTMTQMKKNFSASWRKLAQADHQRLETVAAAMVSCGDLDWLDEGWLHA